MYWENKSDRVKGKPAKLTTDISEITLVELDINKPTRMVIITDKNISINSGAIANSTRVPSTPAKRTTTASPLPRVASTGDKSIDTPAFSAAVGTTTDVPSMGDAGSNAMGNDAISRTSSAYSEADTHTNEKNSKLSPASDADIYGNDDSSPISYPAPIISTVPSSTPATTGGLQRTASFSSIAPPLEEGSITYSDTKKQLKLDAKDMFLLREWVLCLSDLQVPVRYKHLHHFLTSSEISEMNIQSSVDVAAVAVTTNSKDHKEIKAMEQRGESRRSSRNGFESERDGSDCMRQGQIIFDDLKAELGDALPDLSNTESNRSINMSQTTSKSYRITGVSTKDDTEDVDTTEASKSTMNEQDNQEGEVEGEDEIHVDVEPIVQRDIEPSKVTQRKQRGLKEELNVNSASSSKSQEQEQVQEQTQKVTFELKNEDNEIENPSVEIPIEPKIMSVLEPETELKTQSISKPEALQVVTIGEVKPVVSLASLEDSQSDVDDLFYSMCD